MPHVRFRSRLALTAIAVAAWTLAAAPAALADAWRVAGAFAASGTPVLGDAVPADPTAVDFAYDPSSQTLRLRLDFSAPPAETPIHVSAGSTQGDGTCTPAGVDVDIASQARMIQVERTVTEQVWVPERTEIGYSWSSRYPPGGRDWTYLGYDRSSMRHKWLRVVRGFWMQESRTELVAEPDPDAHERVAALALDGADGVLRDVQTAANAATSLSWAFTSPLLDGTSADCVSVRVANRRAAFVLTTPLPDAAPAVESATLRRGTRAHAGRATRTLRLRLRGRASAVQLRIGGRRTAPLPFARAISIRAIEGAPLTVTIRFASHGRWTAWRAVRVR